MHAMQIPVEQRDGVWERAVDDPSWVDALTGLVSRRHVKRIEVLKINGQPPAEQTAIRDVLLAHGFKPGYKGPTRS